MGGRSIPRDLKFFQERTRVTESGCWEWVLFSTVAGHKRGGRYGRTSREGEQKPIGAHRLSHEVFKGQVPEGMEVDHTCYNTLCVNPDHLEIVTPQENNQRRWDTGHGANQNTGKTHCSKCDNEYDGVAKRGDGRTFRYCKPCTSAYQREYHAKRKGTW